MKREENQTVEYKESWHEKYLEWICGYANAKGGMFYIGIEDGTKKPVGVKNPKKLVMPPVVPPVMPPVVKTSARSLLTVRPLTVAPLTVVPLTVGNTSRPYKSTVQVGHTSRTINIAIAESRVGLVLSLLANGELSLRELMHAVGLRNRPSFYSLYILPAFEMGCVEYTIPDRPKSRLQKYRLTDKGRAVLTRMA